jgi:DNA-directed RNA polymerase beta subunit
MGMATNAAPMPFKSILDRLAIPKASTPVAKTMLAANTNEKNISRGFMDYGAIRKNIFSSVLDGLSKQFPVENDRYLLELKDVAYNNQKAYTFKEQKRALVRRKSIAWPVHGTWQLTDKTTGKVVEKKRGKVLDVPYYTRRGTFIYRGNEYVVSNQSRLKAGVFTRVKSNGDLESHFNFMPGQGSSFRLTMDPSTAVFKMQVGHAQIPLYPILKGIGIKDADLQKAWGSKIYEANNKEDNKAVKIALTKLGFFRAKEGTGDATDEDLAELLSTFKLNPQVTKVTLGKPYENVTPDTMLDATKRILSIAHKDGEPDDRDHMGFQRLLSVEDFFKERLERDSGRMSKRMLWKATLRGNLNVATPGVLSQQLSSVFAGSGLGHPPEEINLVELLDQQMRVVRLGEGGIKSSQAVPDESRHVHGSQFAFIDPVRSPESDRVGVDTRLAYGTVKGKNGKLYSKMNNVRTGKPEYVSPEEAMHLTISFPGEMKKGKSFVKAMQGSKVKIVKRSKVDYELPNASNMFSATTNLVPMQSGVSGLRLLMAGKFLNQAMALKKPEAPWVQSLTPDGEDESFEDKYGRQVGSVISDGPGKVYSVGKDEIKVRTRSGIKSYDLYNNFLFNQKSYVHSTPIVKAGDSIAPGQVLAKSNYTNDNGTLSLGTNLRVGFMPYRGYNYEDAIVISSTAADKLRSEHMYKHTIVKEDNADVDKMKYMSLFPTKYDKRQMDQIGENGMAAPGSIVEEGDPLVLAVEQRTGKGKLHKSYKRAFLDRSITWEHQQPGIVTDAVDEAGQHMSIVKAYVPVKAGDKLANRYGNKGVVAKIVDDDKMPRSADGRALHILLNPQGIITRSNPSQVIESALGKVAEARGKAYKLPGFQNEAWIDFAINELKKHGVSDTEDLLDPDTNRQIKKVFTGNMFIMRMHHTAESKGSGRATDMYTNEMIPARGGSTGSKRIGLMEMNALISHNAINVLKDAKYIRGQRNDDFWAAFRLGHTPPAPPTPFIYKKFLAFMKGAGINVKRAGNKLHIMAMTNKDVDTMAKGEITNAETLNYKTMDPMEGGLFDKQATGGVGGEKWSHIKLAEPMPNPVMEDVVRTMLGMTQKDMVSVLSGRKSLNGETGGEAIRTALKRINVTELIDSTKADMSASAASKRNNAIKKLKFLIMFRDTGIKPEELMWDKVPVVPPTFRPISMYRGMRFVSDANLLYQDVLTGNKNLTKLKDIVSDEFLENERIMLYKSIKAVTGLGDPVSLKLQTKKIKGLLRHVIGDNPKFGIIQHKLLGAAVDVVGRAAITPNPSLDMDHVGIPEEKAWTIYRPFIIRRLVRAGTPAVQALRLVTQRAEIAKHAMMKEMESRPVIINRAPTLHKFGLMAAYPTLVKGNTLQISPIVTPGFGADFDGDAMNYHVPVTEKARKEAIEKMLPSRNLYSMNDFDVHYVPKQEYLLGLWQASTMKGKRSKQKYLNKEDVIKAYKRGDLTADQVVEVMK